MIKFVDDKDRVKEIQDALRENDGYCPCQFVKSEDTKCMCKIFRDMMAENKDCLCPCGLYEFTAERYISKIRIGE